VPFQCTDMCGEQKYFQNSDTFCENIHFMNL
jgi:hypothetical protein